MGNLATNLREELLSFHFLDGLRRMPRSSESLTRLGRNEETCRKDRRDVDTKHETPPARPSSAPSPSFYLPGRR